jgi:hypothetical protein
VEFTLKNLKIRRYYDSKGHVNCATQRKTLLIRRQIAMDVVRPVVYKFSLFAGNQIKKFTWHKSRPFQNKTRLK